MKYIDFLEDAASLEDMMADSYEALAGQAGEAGLSQKFNKLHREESNHARVILDEILQQLP